MVVAWKARDLGSDPCCAVCGLPGLGQVTCFTMADLSFPGCPGSFSGSFQLQTLLLSVVSLLTCVQEWAVWDMCTQTPRTPDAAGALLCEGELEALPAGLLPGAGAEVGAGFRTQLLLSAVIFLGLPCFHVSQPRNLSRQSVSRPTCKETPTKQSSGCFLSLELRGGL